MEATNNQSNKELKTRLARIEGQLRGLQKMLDEGRDCKEVMQQLVAVRSGVQAASLAYLDRLADECMLGSGSVINTGLQKEKIKELIGMIGKVS
jgi:DNA-binding FrmR family transcriptional regulator